MIAGQKTFAGPLNNLVLSRTFTCLEIIILGNPVVLALSNMQILMMLLRQNIIWMVGFFLAGS